MHEMPMTTAPMRPTVPALRPFFVMPPASSPTGGASGVLSFRERSSLLSFLGLGGPRDDHHGNGEFVQDLRRGRAEEEPAGLREAARADDRELSGLPAERLDGVFDAVAAGDDDLGVDAAGERLASAAPGRRRRGRRPRCG